MKELYRICKNNSIVDIRVPHPRHDDFISDPTHVRPITILCLQLYDKSLNERWEKMNAANTPLALIHGVNFNIKDVKYVLLGFLWEKVNVVLKSTANNNNLFFILIDLLINNLIYKLYE